MFAILALCLLSIPALFLLAATVLSSQISKGKQTIGGKLQ